MKVTELLGSASDAITVKRVFAEPYEKEGLTVIAAAAAAAAVAGGAGGRRRHRPARPTR